MVVRVLLNALFFVNACKFVNARKHSQRMRAIGQLLCRDYSTAKDNSCDPIGWHLFARLVLIKLILIIPAASIAAVTPGITLSIDSDSIYLGDSVVIELEAVAVLDEVDTAVLFKDADLLRETTGTRIAVIDERVVEVKLRRMEFIPRKEGRVVFGPLTADSIDGNVISNTVQVDVLPAVLTQWQPDEDDLQIAITLDAGHNNAAKSKEQTPLSVYVGQRIVADIIIKHRFPIAEEDIVLPDLRGFDQLPEYEMRRTVENPAPAADAVTVADSSDSSWRVISWRYHLFAQRSGALSIDSVSWKGTAIRSRTQRAAFHKQTPIQSLHVKPSAQDVQWWLPASRVSLSDEWSKDPRELSAGDEIFRTIRLEASNVLASHLPEVTPLESRAISSEAIKQSREQILLDGNVQSIATFTYRMVAQSPIPVFLDTVRVPWYDPHQSQSREAIIPARRINIGLPDRADLLADLALKERWFDRIHLEIRSMTSRFAFWHVSLILLGLIVCILLILEARLSLKQLRSTKKSTSGTSALPRL